MLTTNYLMLSTDSMEALETMNWCLETVLEWMRANRQCWNG